MQRKQTTALNLKSNDSCFHCHENIPSGIEITAQIDSIDQAVCCHGCKAVAEFIGEGGYSDFYQYRGDSHPASKSKVVEKQWLKYDEKILFDTHTVKDINGHFSVSLKIDGMYCSACGWLIDRHLKQLKGIVDVQLNAMTRLLKVTFLDTQIKLSQILSTINSLGYQPIFNVESSTETPNKERHIALKRLLIAGIGMMFVMTISVPLYGAEYTGIDPAIKRFFLLLSMLLSTGVYFYSGIIFVKNALRDISNKHLGMDVPVALSITLAYSISCWNVLSHNQQTTYFDSMVMFVFFLLAGRFVEMTVRHQGLDVKEALGQMIPNTVKLFKDNQLNHVPLDVLTKGDVIQVGPGDVVATDGVIIEVISGKARMNESMITGESVAVKKTLHSKVLAGCIVDSGTLLIKSTSIGNDTILSGLCEMLENAQLKRPVTYQLMDKVASWFVAIVLLLALFTALYHFVYNPDNMVSIVLAVLVATCPCALSLATPAALTAASVGLMRRGILVNNLDAISRITNVDNWYFDKTGTLTEPHMSIAKIHNSSDLGDMDILKIMASLEHNVVHPIASAFNDFYDPRLPYESINNISTNGLQAKINNRLYKTGNKQWCEVKDKFSVESDLTVVYLCDQEKLLASFELSNQLRKGTIELMSYLKSEKQQVSVISGDKHKVVSQVVSKLKNITGQCEYFSEQTPEQKLKKIIQHQKLNPIIMVGDGVNDAPVLAQADVSISFNQATQLARSASDFIIMGDSLKGIIDLKKLSDKTHNIIKQNIIWALLYNLSITPMAIMGNLTPWMAAIGMSVSSLFVVLNAKRILLAKRI